MKEILQENSDAVRQAGEFLEQGERLRLEREAVLVLDEPDDVVRFDLERELEGLVLELAEGELVLEAHRATLLGRQHELATVKADNVAEREVAGLQKGFEFFPKVLGKGDLFGHSLDCHWSCLLGWWWLTFYHTTPGRTCQVSSAT